MNIHKKVVWFALLVCMYRTSTLSASAEDSDFGDIFGQESTHQSVKVGKDTRDKGKLKRDMGFWGGVSGQTGFLCAQSNIESNISNSSPEQAILGAACVLAAGVAIKSAYDLLRTSEDPVEVETGKTTLKEGEIAMSRAEREGLASQIAELRREKAEWQVDRAKASREKAEQEQMIKKLKFTVDKLEKEMRTIRASLVVPPRDSTPMVEAHLAPDSEESAI